MRSPNILVHPQSGDHPLDSPTTACSGADAMSPSKESVKSQRMQRPGSRLQELEQELAKIHHRGPVHPMPSPQPLTPPIPTTQPVHISGKTLHELPHGLLTPLGNPVSAFAAASAMLNTYVSTSGTSTPILPEPQDNLDEVNPFFLFNFYHYLNNNLSVAAFEFKKNQFIKSTKREEGLDNIPEKRSCP